jgi:hypothetical protein
MKHQNSILWRNPLGCWPTPSDACRPTPAVRTAVRSCVLSAVRSVVRSDGFVQWMLSVRSARLPSIHFIQFVRSRRLKLPSEVLLQMTLNALTLAFIFKMLDDCSCVHPSHTVTSYDN